MVVSKRPAAKKQKPMNAFYAQSGGVSAVIAFGAFLLVTGIRLLM